MLALGISQMRTYLVKLTLGDFLLEISDYLANFISSEVVNVRCRVCAKPNKN